MAFLIPAAVLVLGILYLVKHAEFNQPEKSKYTK